MLVDDFGEICFHELASSSFIEDHNLAASSDDMSTNEMKTTKECATQLILNLSAGRKFNQAMMKEVSTFINSAGLVAQYSEEFVGLKTTYFKNKFFTGQF